MPFNTQQGGSAPRRVVFAALLILSIAMVTVYGREGSDGAIHFAQNAVMSVTGQVGRVGAGVGGATGAVGDAVADATANPSTLTGLREQNEELRRIVAEAEEYRQEAERLRDLLDMRKVSGVTGPTAHIIGRSANAWDQSITIDLGKAAGVESGMTIMGATGVLGQVVRTDENSSTVRLLSDPNSGAAVMVQSTRANAIVRGSLAGLLYLEDLEEDQIPEVGDVIVTSGLGGSYERGLIVGAVVSVNRTPSNSTGSIIVAPNDDAAMLEEVIVVFNAPDVAAAEKAAEEKAKKAAEEKAAAEAEAQASYMDEDDEGYYDEGYVEDYDAGYDDGMAGGEGE